jgi:hypothetical protein
VLGILIPLPRDAMRRAGRRGRNDKYRARGSPSSVKRRGVKRQDTFPMRRMIASGGPPYHSDTATGAYPTDELMAVTACEVERLRTSGSCVSYAAGLGK